MPEQGVDFTIEKPGEGVLLLVEAKNLPSRSPEWATRYLHNLYEHLRIPPSDYFLLVFRDSMYLWQHPSAASAPPSFHGDTAKALRPYLSRISYPIEKLSISSFELLIQSWLGELVAGVLPESADTAWLQDSGLLDSVRGAVLRVNLAA